jgi:hypothetical protein
MWPWRGAGSALACSIVPEARSVFGSEEEGGRTVTARGRRPAVIGSR